jgi:hypothetical protein
MRFLAATVGLVIAGVALTNRPSHAAPAPPVSG